MPVAPTKGPIRSIRKEALTGLFTSPGSETAAARGVAFCRLIIVPTASSAVTMPLTATVELLEEAAALGELGAANETGGSWLEY